MFRNKKFINKNLKNFICFNQKKHEPKLYEERPNNAASNTTGALAENFCKDNGQANIHIFYNMKQKKG